MKVVLHSFLFLFSLIADVDAQENFDHRSEIVNFYMADLAVDAKILKYDTANVWIEVLDVLKSNTHNVETPVARDQYARARNISPQARATRLEREYYL